MKTTNHSNEDGNYRKGFQQGCNYGLTILDLLIRNGYTYEEAKAICLDFVGLEVGKYRNDVNSYGHFPPHPQILCESDGKMIIMTYDSSGNPSSRPYNPKKAIGLGSALRGHNSIGNLISELIGDFLQKEDEVPNRLTLFIGQRIRTNRNEAGLSVEELAEKTYLSKGAVRAIEEGKVDVPVSNLIYFGIALNKPLMSFLPPDVIQYLDPQYLTLDEMELLMLLHDKDCDEQKLLFNQIRSLIKGEGE